MIDAEVFVKQSENIDDKLWSSKNDGTGLRDVQGLLSHEDGSAKELYKQIHSPFIFMQLAYFKTRQTARTAWSRDAYFS